ncbi:MAG: 3-oxoacyl-ACP synthase III family protein [Candidatus Binatia bacterium]
MNSVRLSYLSYQLPDQLVCDAVLAERLSCDEESVAALSLGRGRYHAPDGEGPADLAARAARTMFDHAGLGPEDIDFILFATNSADLYFPGSACILQEMLGCGTVACLDLRSGCTGFVTALDVARRFVTTGAFERVLVVAGEASSHQNRFDGRDIELACLMGDGAAVAVVELADGGLELLSCSLGNDGSRHAAYWCEFPASRYLDESGGVRRGRISLEKIETGAHYPRVDFDELARIAAEHLPRVLDDALAQAGLDRVDTAILAHLDPRVAAAVGESLTPVARRVLFPPVLYTASATLPIGLGMARESGEVLAGDTVALLTAGSGASWGCAVVRVGGADG